MALKMHPSLAVHVGDWLKTEIVEPAGVNVTDWPHISACRVRR